MKIYIGCSLTHSPLEFRQYIVDLVDKVSAMKNVEILRFHSNPLKLGGGEDVDVYMQDIHDCVQNTEIMISDCTYPSIGLGWEIATMVEKLNKPVLAIAKEGTTISRLILGAECEKNPLFKFKYYKNEIEVLTIVKEFIQLSIQS